MATDQTPPTNTNLTNGATGGSSEFPSAFSLFKPSWEAIKQNLTELVVIWLVPTIVLGALFGAGSSSLHNSHTGTGIILLVAAGIGAIVYAALLGPAIIHIQLKSSRGEKATYESAFATSKKYWWRFIILSIMIGATVLVGLILLIVPGIIFLKRYLLSQYALIDQDLGLVDSMKKSDELSRGRSMSVYGLMGVDILIAIPNVIPILGAIITFALQVAYFCAPAIRYEQLKALKPAAAAPSQSKPTATGAPS